MTTVRRTRRWRGVVAVALFAGAAGVLFKRPLPLLLAVVGVGYAAYPQVPSPPTVSLDIDRRLDPDDPADGEPVTVEVTVTNTGQSVLPDLRIVDGVPPMLSVSDGTPRHATALRPGRRATFSYEVTATQGTHRFEPATVVARDVSGATEVETEVAADTTIECTAEVPEVPLRQQTQQHVGRIVTNDGGSGVEFHRTREYQRGDDMSRIDWRRFARTGELTTTEFREERAASVVLCLDVRASAYRSPEEGEPHAVAHELAAAEQLLAELAETTDSVGLATLGGRESCWLPPGAGRDHLLRAQQLLATHPALSPYPPESSDEAIDDQVLDLRRRLGTDTQVVLFSPLLDAGAVSAALALEAAGHATTIISPDVTDGDSPGAQLARVERRNRLDTVREAGVRVVDWSPDVALGTSLVHAQERWSA
ncbi:DUF58 domain-containing protein [Halorarius litoreus]|uniref:DUF58 domain-containing protein n=1 Tax=Halorarius litoreus TaxID=2962676 RepID=UPI0020CC2095|nr:DUF58 domain-containing protein [Halorarius litoreus]